jgi:hypothetical protein
VLHALENRLQAKFPGISFHHKHPNLPDNADEVLERLGQLRLKVTARGNQTFTLRELDAAVSNHGALLPEYLTEKGYQIGCKARKRLRFEDEPENRGGRPKIFQKTSHGKSCEDILSQAAVLLLLKQLRMAVEKPEANKPVTVPEQRSQACLC